MKKKKRTGKSISRNVRPDKVNFQSTPIQLAKYPSGEFMNRYNLLLRDKIKGGCGEANKYLRGRHMELFGERSNGVPVPIVKARVCYELMALGYKEHGVEDQLPRGFKQNRAAAMKNDIDGFTPDVGELIRLDLQEVDDATVQKTVKKKTVKKVAVKKLNVATVLCELYWNNNKTKYSDEKILELVKERVGKIPPSYIMANVRRVRTRLNAGQIARYGKPKKLIRSFK